MDERYKVAISRLGKRVRVAGSAELGGSLDTQAARRASQTLYKVLHDWFPGAAQLPTPARRAGVERRAARCCPTARRCIGASGIPGVWLNLGHGSSGWALSCGSARVLADLMGGRDAGRRHRGTGHRAPVQH